jgi:hypothetical protein
MPDRLVICGSMSFYEDMLSIQLALLNDGIDSIIPVSEGDDIRNLSKQDFLAFKRRVSRHYMQEIASPQTSAILVANIDKHGKKDYIGPNTFAEIAVAFLHDKKIFLLQDIPDFYRDELEAWDTVALHRDLKALAKTPVKTAQIMNTLKDKKYDSF